MGTHEREKIMLQNNSLLTAKQVAELLNIGLSTVYCYADLNILKPICLPRTRASQAKARNRRCIRFDMASINEFMATYNTGHG